MNRLVALLVAGYVAIWRRTEGPREGWRPLVFTLGLLFVWAAIDWPIGALGSGYLLSVHEVQYLFLGLIAPPLLLLGVPAASTLAPPADRGWGRLLRRLAHPLPALVAYNLALGFKW